MKPDNQHFSLECSGVNSCRILFLTDKDISNNTFIGTGI